MRRSQNVNSRCQGLGVRAQVEIEVHSLQNTGSGGSASFLTMDMERFRASRV